MKQNLWNRDFTLLTVATVLGAAGGIASSFAMSFLVFDETGSTLAAALLLALELVPQFVIPLVASPWLDRLPRKPFLVAGDALNGVLYAAAGIYLLLRPFTYTGYLLFSLLISCLGAFDSMAYNALYPLLIPQGCEQKGYTVCGMIYPTMQVIMAPVAAVMYEKMGVGWMLALQGILSLLAAGVESGVGVKEQRRLEKTRFSIKLWAGDLKEAWRYLRGQKGLAAIYEYMAVTNGVCSGFGPLIIAFFRTAPGFSLVMYSLFSVAEFAGRTLGGAVHYKIPIPAKKRFGFAFLVYQVYEFMDMLLLWLPYPLMLINRGLCGFLGINSAILRETAVQTFLPDELRAKLNAFSSMLYSAFSCVAALAIGAMGEVMDLRLGVSLCGVFACGVCWATIWRRRKQVREIYNLSRPEE